MNQNSKTYQYQKNISTTRNLTTNSVKTTNVQENQNKKIDIQIVVSKDVKNVKCNKCGKYKYRTGLKKIINETGTLTKKTDFAEKYGKYNTAAKTTCHICGNLKTQCNCKKK